MSKNAIPLTLLFLIVLIAAVLVAGEVALQNMEPPTKGHSTRLQLPTI